MEVVASLSQGRTAAAQCGLFTHKSVPAIFEPPYIKKLRNPPSGIRAATLGQTDRQAGRREVGHDEGNRRFS